MGVMVVVHMSSFETKKSERHKTLSNETHLLCGTNENELRNSYGTIVVTYKELGVMVMAGNIQPSTTQK